MVTERPKISPKYYVVVRNSGRSELFDKDTYWSLIDRLFQEHQSGGSGYDHPKMLIADAVVVIPDKFHEIIWKYGTAKRDATNNAVSAVKKEFHPDWLPDPMLKSS